MTDKTLIDIEEIRRLKHYYYCHLIDRGVAGDESAFEEHRTRFTESVTADFTPFPPFEGKAAVTKYLTKTVPALLSYSHHRVMNDVIDVDGDEAAGLWYFDCPVVYRPGNELNLSGPGIIFGRYEEKYVREDGIWKWQHITALLDIFAEADLPWGDITYLRKNR